MVLLSFPAANRDPAMFPDADKVVIDRKENRHAAFGLGIHRCVGSNLARMEMTGRDRGMAEADSGVPARSGRQGFVVRGHRARPAGSCRCCSARTEAFASSPCYHATAPASCRRQIAMAWDMDEPNDLPPDSKLTRSKQRWAQGRKIPHRQDLAARGAAPAAGPASDARLAGARSRPDAGNFRERWRLDVYGAVENPVFWTFAEFVAQPQTQFISDIHCVTTWSRYDNQWEGLSTRDLLMACQPRDDARFVVLHSHDGYTTNLALEDFAAEDALLAHNWSGKPLDVEHGGPVRLVVPHLYFWKSAKWLQASNF